MSLTYEETTIPELSLENIPESPADVTQLSTDAVPPVGDYEYSCETCGIELKYAGRGRKPRFCAEHKTGAKRSGTQRVSAGRWQQPLCDALTAQFVGIGIVVYPFEQFDGQTIINGSPKLAASLVNVAETNPSVRNALQTFVTGGAWAQVAMAAAAIALPIMQHHNIGPRFAFPIQAV